MNKAFDVDKWPDYFAELAVTNPQQLPLAFLELMKQRLMLAITNQINGIIEVEFNEFEKQLRKELDSNSNKESH